MLLPSNRSWDSWRVYSIADLPDDLCLVVLAGSISLSFVAPKALRHFLDECTSVTIQREDDGFRVDVWRGCQRIIQLEVSRIENFDRPAPAPSTNRRSLAF